MKNLCLLTAFLFISLSSFAFDIPNRQIFIEGTAETEEFLEFFLINFSMEAVGTGIPVTVNKEEAGYIFKFNVGQNQPTEESLTFPPEEYRYVIYINVIRNEDDFEVITFNFFFNNLEEMYEHNRNIFLNAVSVIPPLTEADMVIIMPEVDPRWQNKWLYLRASFDYPISFFDLQGTGLIGGGVAVYYGDTTPTAVSPLDHKIIALPGFTVGAELQFLNFMSIELNYRFFFGEPLSNNFLNVSSGIELKFPIKTKLFMIQPYAAVSFPLRFSSVFNDYPIFALGGGAQIGVKGGRHGAFFLDVKYLHSIGEAVMKNPYIPLYPHPPEIHYKRYVLSLGIGYKFGFGNRKPIERREQQVWQEAEEPPYPEEE